MPGTQGKTLNQPKINQRLVGLFMIGLLVFGYPLLSLFSAPILVFGIPLLYLYLFSTWLLIIVCAALLLESRKGDDRRAPD